MSDFAFDDAPSPRRYQSAPGPSWVSLFTAVLVANLVTVLILFVSVRAYVKWSVEDGIERLKRQPAAQAR